MWFGNRVNGLGGAVPSIDVADCVVLLSTFYHVLWKGEQIAGGARQPIGNKYRGNAFKSPPGEVQVCT